MEGKLGEGELIYSMPPGKSSLSYQAPGHEATSRCGEDKAFWAVGKVSRESWVKTGVGWSALESLWEGPWLPSGGAEGVLRIWAFICKNKSLGQGSGIKPRLTGFDLCFLSFLFNMSDKSCRAVVAQFERSLSLTVTRKLNHQIESQETSQFIFQREQCRECTGGGLLRMKEPKGENQALLPISFTSSRKQLWSKARNSE